MLLNVLIFIFFFLSNVLVTFPCPSKYSNRCPIFLFLALYEEGIRCTPLQSPHSNYKCSCVFSASVVCCRSLGSVIVLNSMAPWAALQREPVAQDQFYLFLEKWQRANTTLSNSFNLKRKIWDFTTNLVKS